MSLRAVVYTRVSTDEQRQASHDDQARNCERVAEREGWRLAHRYTDHGISGAKTDRPQYQAMLDAAVRREFDVLLVNDLSRLSRDQVECERAIRKLEFGGLRIIATADGYDSTSRSRKIQRGVKGLMNEMYRDDLAKNTHRGLEGAALKGLSVGGRAYGYRSEPIVAGGRIVGANVTVDLEQAARVRWIFEHYADGWSPRKIAAALNEQGVPSPGASWKRDSRRKDGKWLASTLYGDPGRGLGILHNELYRGVRVWNRSRREIHPETTEYVFRRRPESEHVRVPVPQLRIVSDELWERARRREDAMRQRYGERVRIGIARGKTLAPDRKKFGANFVSRGMRGPRYAFSGLLKCDRCGASLVVSGADQRYVCASYTNGGAAACGNRMRVRRTSLEERLCAGISDEIQRPEWAELFKSETRRLLDESTRAQAPGKRERVAAVEREIANIMTAIKAGILTPTTKAELEAAEAELTRLKAAPVPVALARMLPRAAERFQRLARELPQTLQSDPAAGQAALRELTGGPIVLKPRPDGGVEALVPLAAAAKLLNRDETMSSGSGGAQRTRN
jgi:site-specific DNA recombinase